MARDRDDDRDDRPRRRDDDDRPRRRDDDDRPRRRDRDDEPMKKRASVLGIFALIIGILSVPVAFIPCANFLAIGTGLLAALLGVIGLVTARGSNGQVGSGLPLTGLILGVLAALLAVGMAVVYFVIAANLPPPPTTSLSTPADVTVTAVELEAAYDNNVVAADAKYKNKIVDVTGVVERVSDEVKKFRLTVELTGSTTTVDCDFSTSDRAALSGLKPGSTVTIRGRCIGRRKVEGDKYVTLENCSVIPPGTPKPPETAKPVTKVTATQLRKEYIDDQGKAAMKFGDQTVEVSGQVTGIDRSTPDVVVGLGVGKMVEVQCVFAAKDAVALANVKPGQQVTIRGTCVGNEDALAFVTVKDSTLVK